MTKDTILSLLRQSPGEFVSGEVIRQAAGVSRAAVSKAVAVLRQEGHEIESVTNRGYRLISLADSLRPEELRQRLTGHHIGQEIVCLPTIDSTNNEIKRRAVSGSVDGLVILADQPPGAELRFPRRQGAVPFGGAKAPLPPGAGQQPYRLDRRGPVRRH